MHTARMLLEAKRWVQETMPWWNRKGGRDHIWLVTHDEGSCWVPAELRPSIILSHWGRKVLMPCTDLLRNEHHNADPMMHIPACLCSWPCTHCWRRPIRHCARLGMKHIGYFLCYTRGGSNASAECQPPHPHLARQNAAAKLLPFSPRSVQGP